MTQRSVYVVGDHKPEPEALADMRERVEEGQFWAAYQNHDMSHGLLGHLQFLCCGKGCTFQDAPKRMPDTKVGFGWRYVPVGIVDLDTGEIVNPLPEGYNPSLYGIPANTCGLPG